MSVQMWSLLEDKRVQIALASAVAIAAGVTVTLALRGRKTPGERERLRRLKISQIGRVASGVVSDVHSDMIHFVYTVAGIEYSAAQEIHAFRDQLPPETDHRFLGPCSVKYLVDNPANSIVLCEGWSGLRHLPAKR